ncbi:MAG: choice-of-anchor L domain-containing protein, partial [Flavobacterium sp.]
MKRFLLAVLFCLGAFVANAQSNIVWHNTNPTMEYEAGELNCYNIVITNTGPTAAQVHVYNPIPAGIIDANFPSLVKFYWTATNGFSGNNQQLDNTINIGVNQTVIYTVCIRIRGDYTAALPAPTVTYKPKADIVVVNTNNQSYYTPGETSTYTVTVTNNGPEAANVNVQNAIPAGVTNFSWTGSNGSGQTNFGLYDQILNMAVGQTVTYTITLTVPATQTGNLVSTTQIVGVNDPAPACPQCVDTDVAPNGADVIVTNTNNQLVYTPGGTATYTVTVTNAGPNAATGVHVTSAIPAGVTTYSWTGSNGTSGTTALDDTIASLADGQTVTYTITLDVPAAQTAAFAVVAQATATTTDPAPGCPQCTDTDYAATSADLVVSQTLNSGTTFTPGATAIYTITLTNNGPTAAQNVVMTSVLPAGITASQVTWTGNNGSSGTGAINNTIPLLLNGQAVTYTLVVDVPANYPAGQNLDNQLSVTSTTTDPDTTCASCLLSATPDPKANIVTYKTNNQATYLAGEQVTYTISVTNAGPSDATNVQVSDPAPYYTSSNTWSGNGSGGAGSLNNTIPVLAAGQTVQYTVNLFVPADFPEFIGNLINTVTVTSPDVTDPVPACPYCTDTDTPRGKFITASNNIYTVDELVKDILIDAECVGITNITSSTGTNYGQQNGIAYFHRENSTFPIKSGVVLTSGNAVGIGAVQGVQGPNIKTSTLGNAPGWPGDNQLETILGGGDSSFDATWIKFNFKPLTATFRFNYLFASEEYDGSAFACNYSDIFAFILTDLNTGAVSNLAVVPNTNTPVKVTTVHPIIPGSCPAINEAYFGQWNNSPAAAAASPINFNGQTKVLTAVGNVDPTHEYSIKLVIANEQDHILNSAVFLEAGSFDIGQPELPGDLTMQTGQARCYEQPYTLSVNTQGISYNITWQHNGQPFLDDQGNAVTTASIQVTEPGTYTVYASSVQDPTCSLTDEIVIEFLPQIPAGNASDLIQCENSSGIYTFDLTQNNAAVSNGLNPGDFPLTIHTSENDATYGFSALSQSQAQNFQGTNGQMIYMRVEDLAFGCYVIRPFKLIISPVPVANQPQPIELCDAGNDNTEAFDLTSRNPQVLGSQDPALYTITFHTSQAAADSNNIDITTPTAYDAASATTVYVRVTSTGNTSCYDVTPLDLILHPTPEIIVPADGFACQADGYVLPVLAVGNYFTQPGGAGTQLNAGDVITTSQTIHIYAQTGTTPNCTDQE